MINQRRVATVILAVCILLGSSACTAKKENRALDELWEAAMVDAVFFEDDEVHELVTLTKQAPDVIWDEAGERVLLLSWHNYGDVCAPFRSTDLIAGTNGIDAVLDGHSHSVISCNIVENKDGEKILLSSIGTGLTNIGQLVIAADGNLIAGLISNFPETDTETDDYVKWIQSQYEEKLNHVVAQIEVTLTPLLESGVRLICNRETNLGDFCADAYRVIADADIAFANGRGIRADINAGDVTYGDMIAVHPYPYCRPTSDSILKPSAPNPLVTIWRCARFKCSASDKRHMMTNENIGYLFKLLPALDRTWPTIKAGDRASKSIV